MKSKTPGQIAYEADCNRRPYYHPRVDGTLIPRLSWQALSAENSAACVNALLAGENVAMVFADGLPESFAGFPVIDGDKHDLRHLDAKGGFIVGLSPKERKAKHDTSGFVVRWKEQSGADLSEYWQLLREAAFMRKAA